MTRWQVYLFATLATGATLWFRLAMDGPLGGRPTLTMFTLPIMLSAYVGGLRGGLMATALSYFGASYFLLEPLNSFDIASPVERWQQVFLVFAGVVISVVNEAMHRARRRADAVGREYEAAAHAASESEARLQLVAENARVGLVMLDPDRRYIYANAAYAELLALPSADVLGRQVAEVLQDQYRTQVKPHLDRAFAGERVGYELQRPGVGGTHYYAVRYEPTWTNDAVSRVIVVISDTTDQKRADAAVHESDARYRTLFEQAPDGIVIADTASNYLDANAGACRMLGYTRDELIGMNAIDIVDRSEADHIASALGVLQSGQDYHRQWWFRRKDGSAFAADVSATTMPDGNLLGMIRDVTARNEAEEKIRLLNAQLEQRVTERTAQLEAANRDLAAHSSAISRELIVAEAADRTKSLFLATMSHELRTPLNSIIGFSSLVLKGMAGPVTPEQIKQLGMVKTSAHHLLELINDVLDLSKIEAGQLEINPSPFDLRESLERVTHSFLPMAQGKGLQLITVISPRLDIFDSDRRRFEQILLNLIGNAVKFTHAGEITIIAEILRGAADVSTAGDEVLRVCISDTGIGIRPENLQSIFSPFKQIDGGLSRQNEGTGLGLAISRRLAQLLGGDVTVESVWNHGSRFTLDLPTQPQAQA